MAFSKEWDDLYQSSQHMSIWPWSDLVTYVHRYAKPSAGYQRVLELGCGAGANITFFLKLGVDYHAIEGSPAIVDKLRETYPELIDRVVAGDFTKSIPFPGVFDLVVDRSSSTCNTTNDMLQTLRLANASLRGGGVSLSASIGSPTRTWTPAVANRWILIREKISRRVAIWRAREMFIFAINNTLLAYLKVVVSSLSGWNIRSAKYMFLASAANLPGGILWRQNFRIDNERIKH